MPTADAVLRLNDELAGRKVLSVYLNAEETDPALRRTWRVRLNSMLKALEEERSTAPREERKELAQAIRRIEEALDEYGGQLPQRGWIGFATAGALHYASPLVTPMPDLVRWEDGAHITPYVRAMKQARPVTTVVADRRQARILRYVYGDLSEERVLRAEEGVLEGGATGSSKRAAAHSGIRGESRDDAARRSDEVAMQRMIRDVLEILQAAGRAGHLLVVAGNNGVVAAIQRQLPARLHERMEALSGIRPDASLAELKEAIETAASGLSLRLQRALVEDVLDTTRSAGKACVGREHVERALDIGAVDVLVLSRNFARTDPLAAERLVDRALAQGATVEEISEAVSEELDRMGGVGGRLRFAA
ncbi:MAG TPA: hypothetical protein VF167_19195 [Longimicrobiaceae bacterium]